MDDHRCFDVSRSGSVATSWDVEPYSGNPDHNPVVVVAIQNTLAKLSQATKLQLDCSATRSGAPSFLSIARAAVSATGCVWKGSHAAATIARNPGGLAAVASVAAILTRAGFATDSASARGLKLELEGNGFRRVEYAQRGAGDVVIGIVGRFEGDAAIIGIDAQLYSAGAGTSSLPGGWGIVESNRLDPRNVRWEAGNVYVYRAP
jgi:hypothetical protein